MRAMASLLPLLLALAPPAAAQAPLPGMPPVVDAKNIYSEAGAGMLSPAVRGDKALVYVPNSDDGTVSVIDPATYRVVRTFASGAVPQHVVPSWDLRTLWVTNNEGNTLTPIDPASGEPGPDVPVQDPYNMYFTPDGRYALVVAEAMQRLDFRDPHSMKLHDSLRVDCKGVDHMDFTADGRYALASCEFSGKMVKIDVQTHQVVGYLLLDPDGLRARAMPQDVRVSDDGSVFYVAGLKANGVYLVDPVTFTRIGFIHTGPGTHGIYPSRDGRYLYVSNRGAPPGTAGERGGTISVIDTGERRVVATWNIPGGGSPDMGNVTADGRELWLSGRYDRQVYVFDTASGRLTHRIPVGAGPHGLAVWPQPGRYSLGHTGNMR